MYNLSTLDQLITTARLCGHHEILRKLLSMQAAMATQNVISAALPHERAAWRDKCSELSIADLEGITI